MHDLPGAISDVVLLDTPEAMCIPRHQQDCVAGLICMVAVVTVIECRDQRSGRQSGTLLDLFPLLPLACRWRTRGPSPERNALAITDLGQADPLTRINRDVWRDGNIGWPGGNVGCMCRRGRMLILRHLHARFGRVIG